MAVHGLIFPRMTHGNNSLIVCAVRVSAPHIFRLHDRETHFDTANGGDPVLTLNGSFKMKDVKFEYHTRPDVLVIRAMTFKV